MCKPEKIIKINVEVFLQTIRMSAVDFNMGSTESQVQASIQEALREGYSLRQADYYYRCQLPLYTVRLSEYHMALTPVTQVGRDDAQAFCQWQGKINGMVVRLPTEAECEWCLDWTCLVPITMREPRFKIRFAPTQVNRK